MWRYLVFLVPFVSSAQWSIIWSDEFNESNLDLTKWTYEIGNGQAQGIPGWGNNELQYYTDHNANISLDSGYLHITAIQESFNGSNYTSARIKTQGLFDFTYGKVEARLKVPSGQGLWPAFWMLGSNINTVSWPACGEIDVMEHVNNELKIYGTAHFDMWGHMYDGDFAYADASDFHLYSIEWDVNEIRWFLDNNLFHSLAIDAAQISREEFHNPFFLLLNMAVGGNWPGNPDGSTSFPATMMVDYVRVYQVTNELEEEVAPELTIMPNPTTDKITLSETLTSYQLVDVLGAEVSYGSNVSEINLQKFAPGVYIIKAQIEGYSYTKQIIKR